MFTEIYDKEGKEVYENDILEICNVERVIVEWDKQIAGFNANVEYADRGWREQVTDHQDTMKVIGNTHENPELLEERK